MTILVTGASGFIGRRMLDHLQAVGLDAIGMGRTRPDAVLSGWITVPDYGLDTLRAATQGMSFDTIVHLAAAGVHPTDRNPTILVDGNALAPVAIVQLAHERSARTVIMGGSSAEYAASERPVLDESAPLEDTALYGATKAAGGLLSLSVAASLGVTCALLRFFNVFGPGEASHRLLPSLYGSLLENRPVALSAGCQIRDFIHVDDTCRAIMAAIAAAVDGRLVSGAYNVSTGTGHSVREFAEAVADAMGKSRSFLGFGALPLRPDDRPVVIGDPSLFRTATGWAPSCSFHEAVVRSVDELGRYGAGKGNS